MTGAYPDPVSRRFITAAVMAATVMNSLDSTIANVALPHIQGSVSASGEEITWVLTSYIVAAAIMTPLTGWLAGRLRLFSAEATAALTNFVFYFALSAMLFGFAAVGTALRRAPRRALLPA